MDVPPRIFISYSHDSDDHAARVRALADQLTIDGLDVVFDQYEAEVPLGFAHWMQNGLRDADFVIVVCTETYLRRAMKQESSGNGRGATWEGHLIYQELYRAGAENTKFLPVLLPHSAIEHIPDPLRHAFPHYEVDPSALTLGGGTGYEVLYRRLTGQHATPPPARGPIRVLSPRDRRQPLPAEISGIGGQEGLPPRQTVDSSPRSAIFEGRQRQPFVTAPRRPWYRAIGALISNFLPMPQKNTDRKTWSDIRTLLEALQTRMESDNFRPDITVAVGREGALVGSLLALNWRLKPFVSIDRDFSFADGTQKVAVHDMIQGRLVQGKSVLLIDCEVNTGTTMREMTAYLIRKGAGQVRTMALARNASAGFLPDYTGFLFHDRAYFPWEYTPALKEIRHVKGLSERT